MTEKRIFYHCLKCEGYTMAKPNSSSTKIISLVKPEIEIFNYEAHGYDPDWENNERDKLGFKRI